MSKFEATIGGEPVNLSLNLGRVLFGRENGSDFGDLEKGPVTLAWMDPSVLGTAVWHTYQDRIKESAGIESESDFNEALDGETRRSIETALKEAISDFFPWGQKLIEKLDKKISNLDQMIDEFEASGHTSTSTPASSE